MLENLWATCFFLLFLYDASSFFIFLRLRLSIQKSTADRGFVRATESTCSEGPGFSTKSPNFQNIICASWCGGGGEGRVRWEATGGLGLAQRKRMETGIHVHMMGHLFNWKEKTLREQMACWMAPLQAWLTPFHQTANLSMWHPCSHRRRSSSEPRASLLDEPSDFHTPSPTAHPENWDRCLLFARSYIDVQNPALPWPFIFGCGILTCKLFNTLMIIYLVMITATKEIPSHKWLSLL